MATASRKSIYNTDLKKRLPVMECIDCVKQVEDNLHTLERVGLDSAATITANCQQAVQQLSDLYAHAVASCAEVSGQSVVQACKMGQGLVEKHHKTASELMNISRAAIECRSADEFYNLQRKMASSMMGYWVDELSEITGVVFCAPTGKCVLPPD